MSQLVTDYTMDRYDIDGNGILSVDELTNLFKLLVLEGGVSDTVTKVEDIDQFMTFLNMLVGTHDYLTPAELRAILIELLPDTNEEVDYFHTEDYMEIVEQIEDAAAVGEDSDDNRLEPSDSEDSDE